MPLPEFDADLVATKLSVPAARPGAVARPAVVARLADAARGSRLTLVSAPAGFGKSSLVAEWARGRTESVGWVSLDANDGDLGRFARYLAAAFRRATGDARLGGDAQPARPGTPEARAESALAPLVNALEAATAVAGTGQPAPIVVLDDVHLAQSPDVAAAFRFLAERLPEGARLVLVTRSDPPLPLARLRLQGVLDELRAAVLDTVGDAIAAGDSAASGRAILTLARVQMARGHAAEARASAERAVALGRRLGSVVLITGGQLVLASLAAGRGDRAATFAATAEAERTATAFGVTELVASMATFRVRLGLALGDLAAASHWAREAERARRGAAWHAQPAHAREAAEMLLARTYLAEGQPARAEAVLEALLPACQFFGHGAVAIEAGVLLALTRHARGREAGALAALGPALAVAAAEDHVRALLSGGSELAVLLRLAARRGVEPDAARAVLALLDVASGGTEARGSHPGMGDVAPAASPAGDGPGDTLTAVTTSPGRMSSGSPAASRRTTVIVPVSSVRSRDRATTAAPRRTVTSAPGAVRPATVSAVIRITASLRGMSRSTTSSPAEARNVSPASMATGVPATSVSGLKKAAPVPVMLAG